MHSEIDDTNSGGVRVAVLIALVLLAERDQATGWGDGTSTIATRKEIGSLAHCGTQSVYQALSWMERIGAIKLCPDASLIAGRRIAFLWGTPGGGRS